MGREGVGDPTRGEWGSVFVTRRCCGAAVCRSLAPELFGEVTDAARPVLPDSYEPGAFTGVLRQPECAEEYRAARTAAAACGFGAIRLGRPRAALGPEERGSPWKRWPRQIEEGVWAIGQPSQRNYGAMAYFLEGPDGGVLVDIPRPNEPLFRWLEAHGGVRWIFLTHADHAQHHAELVARFPGARRVLGAADIQRFAHPFADATTDVEVQLSSDLGPVALDGTPIAVSELPRAEIALLPQPGHTPGGFCLLYRGRFLFTGDHLAYSRSRGHLYAHRLQCWEDWERQTASIAQLAAWAAEGHLRARWVLPGHGEWVCLDDEPGAPETTEALERAVAWMRMQPPGRVSLLRWVPFFLSRTRPGSRLARVVRAFGGAAGEAWVLPAAVRPLLPDHDPAGASSHVPRLVGAGLTALLVLSALVAGVIALV